MKTSIVIITTLVTFTLIDMALAGRGGKGKGRNRCRYDVEWSECGGDGMKTGTGTLKDNQNADCAQTKEVTKKCKCHDKVVSECVDGSKTITFTLKDGAPESCTEKKTVTRKCTNGGRRKNKKNKKRQGED